MGKRTAQRDFNKGITSEDACRCVRSVLFIVQLKNYNIKNLNYFVTPRIYIITQEQDFFCFQISDSSGTIFILCGFLNDTEVADVESRFKYLSIQFTTNEIMSAQGFNFSYQIIAGEFECSVTEKCR